MIATRNDGQNSLQLKLCLAMVALWIPVYLFSVAQPLGTPAAAYSGATQGLLLLLIFVVHASLSYGWKGLAAYIGIVGLAAFLLEACSIATGFPFGYYVHKGAPGPAALGVPVTVVTGYIVLGWFAWTLAQLIARQTPWKTSAIERLATPLIGGFILAGFDYPLDPIGATVRGMWEYRTPSGQFGVPLTNYLGWIFTGWVSFQIFAFIDSAFTSSKAVETRKFWLIPALVWFVIALQYPILLANASADSIELAGSRFVIADIHEAAVAASLFSLVFTSLLAFTKLGTWRDQPRL